jgi:aquaporin Z
MGLGKKCAAEFIGTFFLVLCGCGSAVLTAGVPNVGIGILGVAFAFGLSVLTMAYTVGPVSGGHFNPAVSVGLTVANRFSAGELIPYIISQVVGAAAGAGVLYLIASGKAGYDVAVNGLASNGFGDHSPEKYNLQAVLISEVIFTMLLMLVILGSTDKRAPIGFAPIAIGLCVTLCILAAAPVANLSINPARSLGPALFEGGLALKQVWAFWAAPIVGAIAGALIYRTALSDGK